MAPNDLERLLGFHQERSKESRIADNSKKAKMTNDPEQWLSAPDHFDFAGVDTPSASNDRAVMEFNEGNIGMRELADRL